MGIIGASETHIIIICFTSLVVTGILYFIETEEWALDIEFYESRITI